MDKKNTKKIVIGIIVLIVICVAVFLIVRINGSPKIKIGMNKEKVISFLDKQDVEYEYELVTDTNEIIIINETYIANVKGDCTIFFEDNKVIGARFLPDTDKIYSVEEHNKMVKQLKSYFTKKYGKPFKETESMIIFVKGDDNAVINLFSNFEIWIEWGGFHISK